MSAQTVFLVATFLAGFVAGLRYRVEVLLHLLVLVMGCAISVQWRGGAWSIVVTVALAIPAVQAGYLAGIAVRAAIDEWRAT